MPYARPTLNQLAQEAEADLAARLGAAERPRRNVLTVLARVWAALAHGVYGFIAWVARQMMPYTATDEHLEQHAAWWGVFRKPEVRSQGRVIFTGSPGGRIEAGVLLLGEGSGPTGGRKFQTSEGGRLDEAGEVSISVKALEGGPGGDLPAGASLGLISPQTGVKSQAKVAEGGLSGGAEAEDDRRLRERLLNRVQEPPQGGSANDYRAWALAVPGVTQAWAYGNMFGPGTVGVTVVTDEAEDIIPTPELIAEVQAYLDDPARKPITADVIVFAPVPVPQTIIIRGLAPDTERVRYAVLAELAALFIREAVPGRYLLVSHIREAISVAAGEHDHRLVAPLDDLGAGPTELLTLGEVRFVD